MKFNGNEVFQNAFYKAFCIPRTTFFSHKREFLNGDIRAVNGNFGLEKPRPNSLEIIASLQKIVKENLDISPHRTHLVHQYGTLMPLRLLPSNDTKTILKKCNEDLSNLDLPSVSQSNLSNIWRRYFTNDAIKQNMLFSKCDECHEIYQKLRGTSDPGMIKYWHGVQNFHNEYITCFHLVYYANRLE